MTLNELQQKVSKFRDERNWKKYHNPKDLAISLVTEAVEVLEHFQWKNEKEQQLNVKKHKEDIADELGDVLHNILLIADEFDMEKKYPAASWKFKNKI